MAIMDKLEMFANKAVDKTGELYETGKVKGKVMLEQGKIKDQQLEIGKYVWEAHKRGVELDEEVLARYFAIIEEHQQIINAVEAGNVKDE